MLKILKNKVFVGVFVMALAVYGLAFSANQADAAACTITNTGAVTWTGVAGGVNDGATQGTAVFSGCTSNLTPAVGDTLTIPANVILAISGSATVGGITIADPAATGANGITQATATTLTDSGTLSFTANTGALNQTITLTGSGALAVTGAITMNGSGGAGNQAITGGSGAISAAGITITGGGSTGATSLTTATGTITSSAGITFGGTAAKAQLTVSGAGGVTLSGTTGTIGTGGTVSLAAASTTTFSGSGAQTINTYTYGILVINKGGGTATVVAAGTATVAGALTLTAGGLDTGTGTLAVTGATTIATTKTLTISSGGTANLAALTGTLTGAVTNNGTLSVTTLAIGAGGLVTNAGTLTTTGNISGAGTITNTGTLNFGGTSLAPALTATAVGNFVNYTTIGATVQQVSYDTLSLSGSAGTDTIGAGITIAADFSIGTNVIAALTGNSTSNALNLGGSHKAAGSWGSTGSAATNQTNTFFSGTGMVTAAHEHSSGVVITTGTASFAPSSGGGSSSSSYSTTTTTPSPAPTPAPVTVACFTGQVYSVTTGQLCNSFSPAPVPAPTTTTSTTTTTSSFGTALVKVGSKGSACLAWQTYFNAHGAHLATDGNCGKLTIAFAKTWQASVGLKADGILGAMSRAKAY